MLLSALALEKILESPDLIIIDCRHNLMNPGEGSQLYLESHIPGATYLNIDSDLSGNIIPGITGRHPLPEKASLTHLINRVGLKQDSKVVCYDAGHGAFAARAWWLLRWAGLKTVSILDGGYTQWCQIGLPTTKSIPLPQPSDWLPTFDDDLVVTAEWIQNNLHQIQLIDARATDRFKGENETIDPVGGHIPGAICRPFMENLDEHGCFKQTDEIQQRFSNIDKPIIHYCGSGVTACHNIFAMTLAGLQPGRLYPGSWSEWITNEKHPIER
ncbi:sulfurtransferase [Gynuella sp.]|uniref:sulfurtransferase n=1 Tax=Gynuella sp. TaxID=2969146 RepID=UPI003D12FE47